MKKIFLIIFIFCFSLLTTHYPLPTDSVFAAVGEAPSQEYYLHPKKIKELKEEILGESDLTQVDYLVKPGFSYLSSQVPFTFIVNDLTIDFGILTPDVPAIASNELKVTTGSTSGWQILAAMDHPLQIIDKQATIGSTACDLGDCRPDRAGLWLKNDVYGFGLSLSGDNFTPDFAQKNYYRPFADASRAQSASGIAQQFPVGLNAPSVTKTINLNYKVNVSGSWEIGKYTNKVSLILVPKY